MTKNYGWIRTRKQMGEWAELCFMARAADRGLNVSRPHGESARYDVAVEQNGRFLRIQVKSTAYKRKEVYTCNLTASRERIYARGTVDFFAIYLVPVDVWYIIPFVLVDGHRSVGLTPCKGHKFAQYYGSVEFVARAGEEGESCGSRCGVARVGAPPRAPPSRCRQTQGASTSLGMTRL